MKTIDKTMPDLFKEERVSCVGHILIEGGRVESVPSKNFLTFRNLLSPEPSCQSGEEAKVVPTCEVHSLVWNLGFANPLIEI